GMQADRNRLEHGGFFEGQRVRHLYRGPRRNHYPISHSALTLHAGDGYPEHLSPDTPVDGALEARFTLAAINRRVKTDPITRGKATDPATHGLDDPGCFMT